MPVVSAHLRLQVYKFNGRRHCQALLFSMVFAELGVCRLLPVVKLLSKSWWIPTGATLEGQRAEVGFPTADQGLSSIQGTLFDSYDI